MEYNVLPFRYISLVTNGTMSYMLLKVSLETLIENADVARRGKGVKTGTGVNMGTPP